MKSLFCSPINNLVVILIVLLVAFILYNYIDHKADKNKQLIELQRQKEQNEIIIRKVDSLSNLRRDTLQVITNNYKTILSKQEEVINEIDTINHNDSLIALYYKFRPDSLLFE